MSHSSGISHHSCHMHHPGTWSITINYSSTQISVWRRPVGVIELGGILRSLILPFFWRFFFLRISSRFLSFSVLHFLSARRCRGFYRALDFFFSSPFCSPTYPPLVCVCVCACPVTSQMKLYCVIIFVWLKGTPTTLTFNTLTALIKKQNALCERVIDEIAFFCSRLNICGVNALQIGCQALAQLTKSPPLSELVEFNCELLTRQISSIIIVQLGLQNTVSRAASSVVATY